MSSSLAQTLELPCGGTLPNRIGKSAMTEGLADRDDNPTTKHNTLYQRWAEGGTGLLITGNVMVDRRYLERAGNVVLDDNRGMVQLKSWLQAGQTNGAKMWMQINHPGRQCQRTVNTRPISPSDVQLKKVGLFGRPRPMTEADIQEVIGRFVTTAKLAKKAGFDGVQVHAAHGYLISQFLSPITNRRSDQWGGSLENRARFLREVVRAVRQELGADYPVSVKLNSADFQKGGFSLEECIQVAGWLAKDSIDLLEISGGSYEQLGFLGVEPTEVRDTTRRREAYFIEYANAIRENAQIPLMITGGFRSREVMENAIASGEVDVIGLARPLCTQPSAPQQLIDGSLDMLDLYENSLVLGKGFWGQNSQSSLIRTINDIGSVGFYYHNIIRLAQGLEPKTDMTVLREFVRHGTHDFGLSRRRSFRG
ncbi:MAG: NADH:flavin oxidoreductase/NADH oxidase family protein [Chloroflexota bacterium]